MATLPSLHGLHTGRLTATRARAPPPSPLSPPVPTPTEASYEGAAWKLRFEEKLEPHSATQLHHEVTITLKHGEVNRHLELLSNLRVMFAAVVDGDLDVNDNSKWTWDTRGAWNVMCTDHSESFGVWKFHTVLSEAESDEALRQPMRSRLPGGGSAAFLALAFDSLAAKAGAVDTVELGEGIDYTWWPDTRAVVTSEGVLVADWRLGTPGLVSSIMGGLKKIVGGGRRTNGSANVGVQLLPELVSEVGKFLGTVHVEMSDLLFVHQRPYVDDRHGLEGKFLASVKVDEEHLSSTVDRTLFKQEVSSALSRAVSATVAELSNNLPDAVGRISLQWSMGSTETEYRIISNRSTLDGNSGFSKQAGNIGEAIAAGVRATIVDQYNRRFIIGGNLPALASVINYKTNVRKWTFGDHGVIRMPQSRNGKWSFDITVGASIDDMLMQLRLADPGGE